jgi:hypothetical protein
MYLNGYSVRIPEGLEQNGYVELRHDTQYRLMLRNSHKTRCDARVEVDGKCIGTFRLDANESIVLERPAHDRGRFTFYKDGSRAAKKAGLSNVDPWHKGLVSVTFSPEKDYGQWFVSEGRYTAGQVRGGLCSPSVTAEPNINWNVTLGSTAQETDTVNRNSRSYMGAGSLASSSYSCDDDMVASGSLTGAEWTSGYVSSDSYTSNRDRVTRGAGGTGLSGHSGQNYYETEAIEYDTTRRLPPLTCAWWLRRVRDLVP